MAKGAIIAHAKGPLQKVRRAPSPLLCPAPIFKEAPMSNLGPQTNRGTYLYQQLL